MPSKTYSLLLSLLTIALFLHWLRVEISSMLNRIHFNDVHRKKSTHTQSPASKEVRYLSYQPSHGDWNEQRLILENAIVIAKMLNRTLIIRPVITSKKQLQLGKRHVFLDQARTYNKIPEYSLVPVSQYLNLERLKNLLPIIEEIGGSGSFFRAYRHLSWHTVCHDTRIGVWIDKLPEDSDILTWSILRRRLTRDKRTQLPPEIRACPADDNKITRNPSQFLVWGVENELSNINARMLYFPTGSLNMTDLYFTTFRKAFFAQIWLKRHVIMADWIRSNVYKMISRIGIPFDAIYMNRRHFKQSNLETLWYRLDRQDLRSIRSVYVAGRKAENVFLKPLTNDSLRLFFADDFADILGPHLKNSISITDFLNIHEEMIIAMARKLYFSDHFQSDMFIRRARNSLSTTEYRTNSFSPKWIGKGLKMPIKTSSKYRTTSNSFRLK